MNKLFWAACLLWWVNAIGFFFVDRPTMAWGSLFIAGGLTLYSIVRQRREAALLVELQYDMRNFRKALEPREKEKP